LLSSAHTVKQRGEEIDQHDGMGEAFWSESEEDESNEEEEEEKDGEVEAEEGK